MGFKTTKAGGATGDLGHMTSSLRPSVSSLVSEGQK